MYELIVIFNKYFLTPLNYVWNKLLNKTVDSDTAFDAHCLRIEHGEKIKKARNHILLGVVIGVAVTVIGGLLLRLIS